MDKILWDSLLADKLFFDYEFDKVVTRFDVTPGGSEFDEDIIKYLAERVERCGEAGISSEEFATELYRFSLIRLRIFFRGYLQKLEVYLKSLFDGDRFKAFCQDTRGAWYYFEFFDTPSVKTLGEAHEAYGFVTRLWVQTQVVLDREEDLKTQALMTLLGNSEVGASSEDAKRTFDELMGNKPSGFSDEEFDKLKKEQTVKALQRRQRDMKKEPVVEEIKDEVADIKDIFDRAEKAMGRVQKEGISFTEAMEDS